MDTGTGVVVLTPPERHWACPACGRSAVTRDATNARMHSCPRTGGLLTPYLEVPLGADAESARGKVTVHLREDYVRHGFLRPAMTETLQYTHDGKPAARVSVEGADGQQKHSIFVPGINIKMGVRR